MDGKIYLCEKYCGECGYSCCHQCHPSIDNSPENSLLIYPGELDGLSADKIGHITIKNQDFFGGKLGYCNRECFDQSKCSSEVNYKPLDCRSFPFFPSIQGGKLVLVMDQRCPIKKCDTGMSHHYKSIFREWSQLLMEHPELAEWIASIRLEGYVLVEYE